MTFFQFPLVLEPYSQSREYYKRITWFQVSCIHTPSPQKKGFIKVFVEMFWYFFSHFHWGLLELKYFDMPNIFAKLISNSSWNLEFE